MNLQQYNYHCPDCQHNLNTSHGIKLKVSKDNINLGYIYLNPDIGNYEYILVGDLSLKENFKYDFDCPICLKNLTSDKCDLYASLRLKVTEDVQFDILFSKICNDHKTLIVTEENEFLKGDQLHKYITELQFDY